MSVHRGRGHPVTAACAACIFGLLGCGRLGFVERDAGVRADASRDGAVSGSDAQPMDGISPIEDGGSPPPDGSVIVLDAGPPLPGAVDLSAGAAHNCVALTGGTAACWGANTHGQLGDGTTVARGTPVEVAGLGGVVQISAGATHSCALLESGSFACWGSNGLGELGGEPTPDRATAVIQEPATPYAEIRAGDRYTCGRTAGGVVYCWGNDELAQLGNGDVADAPVTGVANAIALSAGYTSACVVRSTGSVTCWGDNTVGQLANGTVGPPSGPVAIAGISGIVTVHAGPDHTCAREGTRALYCWGDNSAYESGGGGRMEPVTTPTSVAGTVGMIFDASAGRRHTCIVNSRGEAHCWGDNGSGRLGSGGAGGLAPLPSAARIDFATLLDGVVEVGAGSDHTCARLSDGGVACWGSNGSGQIGDGSGEAQYNSVDVARLP